MDGPLGRYVGRLGQQAARERQDLACTNLAHC